MPRTEEAKYTITVSKEALEIARVFLPTNPNRLRNAAQGTKDALNEFIRAMEAAARGQ